MKKRCRAENAECRLETGGSIFEGSLKFLRCELCCTEPGFCRGCICLLCCKALKSSLEENFTVRCLRRMSAAGICGHAVHLSCALDSQMAGVVKLHGIDMEYLCRRCDQKTDLKDVIAHLVGGMAKANSKSYAEKMLKLALRTIQGSERGGHETKMLERAVHWALDKITKGENVETLLEPVADGSDPKPGDERQHQTKESFPYLPPCNSLPLHVSSAPSGSIAGAPTVVARESNTSDLSQGFRQDNAMAEKDPSQFRASLVTEADTIIEALPTKTSVQSIEMNGTSIAIELNEKSQAEDDDIFSIVREDPIIRTALGSVAMSNGIDITTDSSSKRLGETNSLLDADEGLNPVAVEAQVHAPEKFSLPSKALVDSRYERDIEDALQKLKNRQADKFLSTKQCLDSKKKEVMDRYHQLNLARNTFATQAPSMPKDKASTLLEQIASQAACLEKEHLLFEELLQTCRTFH